MRLTHPFQSKSHGVQTARAAVSGLLCASLLSPFALASGPVRRSRPKTASALTRQQRTEHALDRLTFGPRPGDAAAADRIGLDAWFQQQLHPETIPDTALEARLAQYPAMQLPQEQLFQQFPTPAMLKRYEQGTLTAPNDAISRAVYGDAGLLAQEKREAKKEAKASSASNASPAAGTAQGAEPHNEDAQGVAEGLVKTAGAIHAPVMMDTAALMSLGPDQRLARLLSLSPEQAVELRSELKRADQLRLVAGMTPQQREIVEAMRSPERMVTSEDTEVRLLRDVYSQRQLQAVMADFWLNHFNVYLRKNQNEPYLLPAYAREVILPNALGNFEDLLVATAKSPAMLLYLDNAESVGPDSPAAHHAQANGAATPAKAKAKGINENYARELMELHTLGVGGGYTQQDVVEIAKCFTGWTVDKPAEGGTFVFNPNRHEPGSKTVLGHVIPEGGMQEGLEVLHLLATSPATAHFISLELAQRFVSDTPPTALVDRMSATFLKSGGDLKAVLTTMYQSPEFWSPAVYRAKVKTPLEFLVSALRATDAEISDPRGAVQALDRLGMPLYGMQTPNGYAWDAASWVNSNALLTRMNFALVFSSNRVAGTQLNWSTLLKVGPAEDQKPDQALEQKMELALLGGPASPQTRMTALAQADSPGLQQQAEQSFRALPVSAPQGQPTRNRDTMSTQRTAGPGPQSGAPLATLGGLLLGSPEFQRR